MLRARGDAGHVRRRSPGATLGRPAHVLEPVPPAELLSWVASADVGGVLIQKSTLNHYLSTPNKLFECLAAGVPVVASDFPTMRRIVVEDPGTPGGGLRPSRVDDVAAELRLILGLEAAAARSLRDRCAAAAQSRWNWEAESVALTSCTRTSSANRMTIATSSRREPPAPR